MPGQGLPCCKDEALVGHILDAVVRATDVPVTLKIRIGWNRENKNGIAITRIAESAGVQALALHGRTRGACTTPVRPSTTRSGPSSRR